MDLLFISSSLGTISSIINSVIPTVEIFKKIKADKIEQIPASFLGMNHACQFAWLIYAFMIGSMPLIIVNLFTGILSVISLFLYVIYSKKLNSFLPFYLISVAILISLSFTVFSAEFLGYISLALTIIAILSSLESLQNAIRTNDYNYININMNLSGLFNSATWLVFGMLTGDFAVIYSCIFGIIVGIINMLGYFYYKRIVKVD